MWGRKRSYSWVYPIASTKFEVLMDKVLEI